MGLFENRLPMATLNLLADELTWLFGAIPPMFRRHSFLASTSPPKKSLRWDHRRPSINKESGV